MKSYSLILKVTLSVSLIVLSIAVPVNRQLPGKAESGNTQVADGVPLPPPPPSSPTSVLVADGVPLPPPPPSTTKLSVILTADGVPLPPLNRNPQTRFRAA
jgi:hypothetical protein